MAEEIERRFLVVPDFNPEKFSYKSVNIAQSYLPHTGSWTIRVRREESRENIRHIVTMKLAVSGMTNKEYEHEITPEEYKDILSSCYSHIEKTRHYIKAGERTWEVDVYKDETVDPRILAEIELASEDENLKLPEWIAREITGDRYYSNHQIAERLTKADRRSKPPIS